MDGVLVGDGVRVRRDVGRDGEDVEERADDGAKGAVTIRCGFGGEESSGESGARVGLLAVAEGGGGGGETEFAPSLVGERVIARSAAAIAIVIFPIPLRERETCPSHAHASELDVEGDDALGAERVHDAEAAVCGYETPQCVHVEC